MSENVIPIKKPAKSLLESALEYSKHGWKVLPLKPSEKIPYLKWEKASSDAEVINRYWQRWPNANIGILTGSESGLFVLDVDGEPGKKSLEALVKKHGELHPTLCQATGKGMHYFFHTKKEIRCSAATKLGTGLDVRCEKGYIIVAPSVHPNGSVYTWQEPFDPRCIHDLPDWLAELARKGKESSCDSEQGFIPIGQRNKTLFDRGMSEYKQGKCGANLYTILATINEHECEIPVGESELKRIFSSIKNYGKEKKYLLYRFREFIRSATFPGSSTMRLVLLEISFYMDKDGHGAFPSQQTIAARTGLSREIVNKKLKEAVKQGIIGIKKYPAANGYQMNVYYIPKGLLTM